MALIDREKLTKTVNERLDSTSRKRPPAKAAYQKYFDGYTTYTVKKKNGKGTKTIRIYTSEYYTHDCDDKTWRNYKLGFAGLTILAIALYLLAALGPSGSALWPLVAVPGCLTMAGLVMHVAYLICYLLSPRLMTVWTQAHYHKFLLVFSLISWAGLVVTALFSLVYMLFVAGGGYLIELLTTVEYAGAAAAIWCIWRTEKNMDYCTVYNEPDIPDFEDMVIIQ